MASKNRKKQLAGMKKRQNLKGKNAALIVMPSDPRVDIPAVNYSRFAKAIAERDPAVWASIIEFLMFFEGHHYLQLGIGAIKNLNQFIQLVYTALLDEEFRPGLKEAIAMVQYGHVFQHLVALTGFQTNDAALAATLLQQGNLPKALFLENPRCEAQLPQSKLFDLDPIISSMWYNTYILGLSSPTSRIQKNLFRHIQEMDERWTPYTHQVTSTYFTCTYINPDAARRCKGIINRALKKAKTWTFNNTPQDGKPQIAIVTNKWHRNHAVYKSAGALVEQLLGYADLHLVWTDDKMPDTAVTDYFTSVMNCYFRPDGELVIPPGLQDNSFNMVYFPDIGMSNESIWLSNCRIAPIQAMGYGHPDTSGDNSEIDYFIGGDVEKESTDKYAETMVLIPGLGQHPAWPTYERKHNYKDDSIVRVNCVWGPDKYNYTLLTLLAEINNEVERRRQNAVCNGFELPPKHEFHLFGSPGMNRYAALPSFRQEVLRMLPNATLHTEQEYYDYMENAEMHDFSINSFPFGCYNVLVESLYLGLPFITLVGDRFYNKAGMWLNERIGMHSNNFQSPRELINHAADLIQKPVLLTCQRDHLARVNLKESLFDTNDYFKQAVEHILTNHPFSETKIIGA